MSSKLFENNLKKKRKYLIWYVCIHFPSVNYTFAAITDLILYLYIFEHFDFVIFFHFSIFQLCQIIGQY